MPRGLCYKTFLCKITTFWHSWVKIYADICVFLAGWPDWGFFANRITILIFLERWSSPKKWFTFWAILGQNNQVCRSYLRFQKMFWTFNEIRRCCRCKRAGKRLFISVAKLRLHLHERFQRPISQPFHQPWQQKCRRLSPILQSFYLPRLLKTDLEVVSVNAPLYFKLILLAIVLGSICTSDFRARFRIKLMHFW